MKLLEKISRIPQVYAQEGFGGLSRTLAGRIVEHTEFVGAQLDLRSPLRPAQCALAFELRLVDDALFERFRTMPAPFPRHYEYRAMYGMRRCYGAWVGEEIGCLVWPVFQADNKRMVTRWRYLLPDEARLASIWASPKFRGTGLIDACYARFERIFRDGDFRYFYTFTWVGNRASRRMSARRGMHEVGSIHRFSFRWQREGHGIYIRHPIPREALEPTHPGGDLELPAVID
jgi:RimJ/RimL family protein N-acetyltransferase